MISEAGVHTHLRKGVLQYCVLACLRGEPKYGREIALLLSKDRNLLESEGTLYPLLSRMRSQGLVTTAWRESSMGPPRRYYELTEAGVSAIQAFDKIWTSFRNDVDDLIKEVQE